MPSDFSKIVNVSMPALRSLTPAQIPAKPPPTITTCGVRFIVVIGSDTGLGSKPRCTSLEDVGGDHRSDRVRLPPRGAVAHGRAVAPTLEEDQRLADRAQHLTGDMARLVGREPRDDR